MLCHCSLLLSWPGEVKGWPLFSEDEIVFSEVVHAWLAPIIEKGDFEYVNSLSIPMITKKVAQMLRPNASASWVKLSGEMKEAIASAKHHAAGLDCELDEYTFSCFGASWLQEARRISDVLALEGTALTHDQVQVLSMQPGFAPDQEAEGDPMRSTRHGRVLKELKASRTPPFTVLPLC